MAIQTTYTSGTQISHDAGDLLFTKTVRVNAATTNITSGDTIELLKVPKGAVLTFLSCNVATVEDSACSIVCGDGSDTNRYLDTVDMTVLGKTNTIYAGLGYVYTAADTIDIVVTGAADTMIVDFTIQYAINPSIRAT